MKQCLFTWLRMKWNVFALKFFIVLPPYKLSALIQDILQTSGLFVWGVFFRNFPFFQGSKLIGQNDIF